MPSRSVIVAFAAATLLVAGCGGAKHETTGTTLAVGGTVAPTTTTVPSTTSPTTATTIAGATTTVVPGLTIASVSGTYVAGTADGGYLYIRADGASRFLAPDGSACPACSTADSPIASIDFGMQSIALGASDTSTATGVVTATSDAPWAARFPTAPKAGSSVSVTFSASRRTLNISFLPGTDPLTFTSRAATITNTPPCTVAAVTPAVQADQPGATVVGVTCAVDREWAAASVSVHGIDEVVVLEAKFTTWKAVDRPTVCNGRDVPADFFQAACGTS